jgi:hypothetical protein
VTGLESQLSLTLKDLDSSLDWLSTESQIKYRVIVYDAEQADYPPSLDMTLTLLPAEKRFAFQELIITVEDGTFIDTPVVCGTCRVDPPEFIITYQVVGDAIVLKPFDNRLTGDALSLSCVNSVFAYRGDCPIAW